MSRACPRVFLVYEMTGKAAEVVGREKGRRPLDEERFERADQSKEPLRDRWRHSWIKLISKDLVCDLAALACFGWRRQKYQMRDPQRTLLIWSLMNHPPIDSRSRLDRKAKCFVI